MNSLRCLLRGDPSGIRGVILLLALFGFAVGAPGSADAQQYVFELSSPTIIPGTAGDVTLTLDSTGGLDVNGVSVAFCFDDQLLSINSIAEGFDTLTVNGGMGPDFFSSNVTDGVAVVGIIPSLVNTNIGYAPGVNEIFVASVTAIGNPGTLVPIDFCNTMTVFNAVSCCQPITSFTPTVIAGVVTTGMTAGGNLTLEPFGPPVPGSSLPLAVLLDSATTIDTISFGFTMPSPDLALANVIAIGPLAAANGGAGPASLVVTPGAPGEFTVEVDLGPAASLAAGVDLPILQINLDVDPALSGNCVPLDLEFSSTVGAPAVPIEVTSAGMSLPTTSLGTTVFTTSPPNVPPSGGTTLSIGSSSPIPGTLTNLEVILDSDDLVAQLSFGLTFDPTDITLIGIQPGQTLQDASCGNGPDFLQIDLIPGIGGGLTFQTTIETMSPIFNPYLIPDGASSILELTFTTSPSPSIGGSALTFTGSLGTPLVPLEAITRTAVLTPATIDGSIDLGSSFIRTDCNADMLVDIGDAVFSLGLLFPGPGGPVPTPCTKACDSNDDGTFDLADAIFLLGVLFTGGGPVPAPTVCGIDPTLDTLDCAMATCP